jgi:hypothetical protein
MFLKFVFLVLSRNHTPCFCLLARIKWKTLTESEEPNSASRVVVDVLAHKTKKNKFLRNVGIQNGQPRCGMWGSSVLDIQTELDAEKRANVEL